MSGPRLTEPCLSSLSGLVGRNTFAWCVASHRGGHEPCSLQLCCLFHFPCSLAGRQYVQAYQNPRDAGRIRARPMAFVMFHASRQASLEMSFKLHGWAADWPRMLIRHPEPSGFSGRLLF